MSDTLRHALTMFAAGLGIPVLAALNAQLGSRIGAPVTAAVVLFGVAMLAGLVAVLMTSGLGPLRALPGLPPHLFLAGVLMAFYVIAITTIAPRLGVGNAVFCVLLGQMVAAAVIDHFGLFGALTRPVGLTRAAGLVLMAAGLVLIQRG